MIKVAILDNGLNRRIYGELTGKCIESYKIIKSACVLDDDRNSSEFGINHGTVCAAILTEFACEVEILSISLEEQGNLPMNNLETALIWCINNQVNMICMSVGSNCWLEIKKLIPLFHTLANNDIVVVAATANNNRITFPAALPTVIGVRNTGASQRMTIIKNPIDGIDIETVLPQSNTLLKLREKYNFITPLTNSVVTPYVTAKIAKYLLYNQANYSLQNLKFCFGSYMTASFVEYKNISISLPSENLLILLNKINIPVIGLIYEEGQSNYMAQLSLLLQRILCSNQYNAVLLSTCMEINIENNIYKLDESQIDWDIIKYFQITLSDLILLHIPTKVLTSINGHNFIDLFINCKFMQLDYYKEEDTIITSMNSLNLETQAEFIYQELIETFI